MTEAAQDNRTRLQHTGEAARTEASATAGQARQAAGRIGETAVDQAKAVAGEARQQVGAVAGDLRSRAMNEAEQQSRRAAGSLHQWADDLAGLAENAKSDSPARNLAAQAADGGHRAADYLEEQGVEGVLTDMQDFARRRPGMFLGGALLAGLVVGRFVKAAAQTDGASGAQGDGAAAQQRRSTAPGSPAPTALPSGPPPETQPSVGMPPGGAPNRPTPGV
ncbi:hypothetical protein [Streptomyces sp. NBC_00582]|uniref:hypothetical protein n=1 Tax=Streptomyces sp. NBC_00582 TaxID=2975783 RepID=UPI002E823869|nr:hypothetical protein [Streptomyces sp. NBC_00582]WUB66987.1 hypothetical protein OG852_44595 [Streptomyces sp. NBC_00582]